MDNNTLRQRIQETLIKKSALKQKIFDNTFAIFNEL